MPEPWYREGLRFACTRCGNCCTGASGTVRLTEVEAAWIARHLGLEPEDFRERFTRRLEDGSTSLVEKANLDCVFWSREHGCTVHPVRPRQCRTWPFWRANLQTPRHWIAASRSCPGMDRGPWRDAGWIAEQAADDGTSGAAREVGSD